MPTLTVIAGENGAGKTTLVKTHKIDTIDPDKMTRDLGKGYSVAASIGGARAALMAQREALEKQQSFGIETTLASRQPINLMQQAKAEGYKVHLAFVIPHDEDDTRLRIDNRVLQGGHNIGDEDLKRRSPIILQNLPDAMKQADVTALYVSSEKTRDFVMVGTMYRGEVKLTPEAPERLRTALEGAFPEVQNVDHIGPNNPVAQQFKPHIQRDLNY